MMKFREIFRFEIGYQLRRAWPWLITPLLMFLVFLFVRDGSLGEAMYTEFFINGPFMVAMATVFGCLLWLLTTAFVAGEAAARDVASGMNPLTYSLPVNRAQYLGGKFLAVFTINAVILLCIQISILLACYLPGVHPDSLGPFRPEAFLTAYFYIAIPNAIAATTIQFAFSLHSGRPIAAYMGSLFLFFTTFFLAALILFNKGAGTLLDPIGIRFVWDELSHLWTTYEKSWRLLELKGTFLHNRLIWIGTGIAVAAFTYLRFEFTHRTVSTAWWYRLLPGRKFKPVTERYEFKTAQVALLHVKPNPAPRNFGFTFQLHQILAIARSSVQSIASSKAGLAMLIFIPLVSIAVIIDQVAALRTPLIPTTIRVIKELTGPLAGTTRWMVIPGFIIYFTGELVWRERDNRLNEITDAMPGTEWAPALGKYLGMTFMLTAFMFSLCIAGVIAQLIRGYTNFEPALYLKIMFGLQLPEYLIFAALALCIHSVVNQKYVGHLVAIMAYAFIVAVAGMLNIEHNLLIYGAGPGWAYTEMRGFGNTLAPWLWFRAYWAAWALLLTVIAMVFWVRGKENKFIVRLRLARQRMHGATVWTAVVAIVLVLLFGGYVFYNTNILNNYVTGAEAGEWSAEYEKLYGQYENTPQPNLVKTKLHLEVYPEDRTLDIRGTYVLRNSTRQPIDSIHVSMAMGVAATKSMTFDQVATLVTDDSTHRYRIYALKNTLKPGDSINLTFDVHVESPGFRNRGADPSLVADGSAFDNKNWFPVIGYQRTRGVVNPTQRRKYGLPPRELLASLYGAHDDEPLSFSSGVTFEAVIGTTHDQVAVAPGVLQRTWPENSRQYFEYKTSAPIGDEWNFFSSHYAVFEKTWHSTKINHPSVVVKIYHYPGHTTHLETMMRSATTSLEYYTEQFGPYPYSHLTIIEHPAAPGTGMHAEAGMIYCGQGYPYLLATGEHSFDLPYAVMGHEMGHQWSLPYAYVEGLPFLAEGVAWYYSIMLVNNTRGPEQIRKLMSFMRQPYPHAPIRHGEPLMRALDPYLAYKRGPLAMYALTQYAGIDNVNQAIRTLVTQSNAPGAEPVSTLDLYHELQKTAPDSVQTLLHDLFEVNTLWEFEADKITAVKSGAGQWTVTLDVFAKKITYDTAGTVTEVPMDEWIPVGVFTHAPEYDELGKPLHLKYHRIKSGRQTITITVSGEPVLAGIDPYHVLDWDEKEDDDNVEGVLISPSVKP